MIHSPRIFIGVLTHPSSRFSVAHTKLLSSNLNRAGIVATLEVCKENLIENSWKSVTRRIAMVSAVEYGLLRIQWYRQLSKRSTAALGFLLASAHLLKELVSLLLPGGLERTRRSMIRLRNISLAHARLWHQAMVSESEWILMLEDDAYPTDSTTLELDLLKIIEYLEEKIENTSGIYCDASLSYSSQQLGVRTLDNPCLLTSTQTLYTVEKPFTNTLCAVLMSRTFVQTLSAEIHMYLENPKNGFMPIDWLVNKYILENEATQKYRNKFYKIQPGLYVQRSIHAEVQVID